MPYSKSLSAGTMDFSNRRAFALLYGFALAFRIILVIAFPEGHWTDGVQYDRIARNLLAGHGFTLSLAAPFEPTMFREPIYPLFLAVAYALPGNDLLAATALQVLLSALTCGFVYWLALEIGVRRPVALVSGLFTAVHPGLALYSGRMMSETIAVFVVAIALWSFARAWRSGRALDFVLAGVASGLMALTKAALLPLPFCLAAVYLLVRLLDARRNPRAVPGETGEARVAPLKLAAVFALAAVCTIAPWSIRNKVQLGSAGLTVRVGEMIWARAHTMTTDLNTASSQMSKRWSALRAGGLSEAETDARMGKEGLALIAASPGQYLRGHLTELRLLWICSPESRTLWAGGNTCMNVKSCATAGMRSLALPAFMFQALLILAGAALFIRAPGPGLIPVLAVAFLTVLYSFFTFNSCRYAMPILPAAMVLCAEGVCASWLFVLRLTEKFRLSPAA